MLNALKQFLHTWLCSCSAPWGRLVLALWCILRSSQDHLWRSRGINSWYYFSHFIPVLRTTNNEHTPAYWCISPAGGEEEEIWKRKTRNRVVTVIATFSLYLSIQICREKCAKTGSNWVHWVRLKFRAHPFIQTETINFDRWAERGIKELYFL